MKARSLPTVDVIVPCYNYARFLPDCVKSLVLQDNVDVRILIIDDTSTDNTPEVARELTRLSPHISYVRHERNMGPVATFNEGLNWVSSEYMLLISADDYLLPGAFHRAISLMEADRQIGFTFGKTVDLQQSSGLQETETFPNRQIAGISQSRAAFAIDEITFLRFLEASKAINIVRTPTAIVRTDVQKRIGHYRADLPHSGDLEMWLRFSTISKVGIINEIQAVSRFHGANMQNSFYSQRHLGDLTQRKAAFDVYFNTRLTSMTELSAIRPGVMRALSRQAIECASEAIDHDQRNLSRTLEQFAIEADPGVRWAPIWYRMRLKRLLGRRVWGQLRNLMRPSTQQPNG